MLLGQPHLLSRHALEMARPAKGLRVTLGLLVQLTRVQSFEENFFGLPQHPLW